MLLANPHLPWADQLLHLFRSRPERPRTSRCTARPRVGLPVLALLLQRPDLGFTNTVNTLLGATTYLLTPSGDGYLFDGKTLPFTVRTTHVGLPRQAGRRRR